MIDCLIKLTQALSWESDVGLIILTNYFHAISSIKLQI